MTAPLTTMKRRILGAGHTLSRRFNPDTGRERFQIDGGQPLSRDALLREGEIILAETAEAAKAAPRHPATVVAE